MRLVYYSNLGYHELHFSQCSVLNGEVCREVIRQVIGVPARVSCTHRTDYLLQRGGVAVLFCDMLS